MIRVPGTGRCHFGLMWCPWTLPNDGPYYRDHPLWIFRLIRNDLLCLEHRLGTPGFWTFSSIPVGR